MGTDLNRDGQLDGLLRNAVRAETPVGPCLDAEQIAAWIDGGLTHDEAQVAEQHLSTCAACRRIASVAGSTGDAEETGGTGPRGTEASPVVVPFVPRVARWKVAVTAAGAIAASVLIWVAVRQPESTPALESTAAVSRQSAPQPLSPGLSVETEAAAAARRVEATTPRSEAKARQGQGGQANPDAQAAQKPRPLTRATPAPAAPAPLTPTPTALPVQQAPARTEPPPPPVAVPPPPPPPASVPPPARTQTTTALPPVATQTAAVSSAMDSARLREAISLPVIVEFVAGANALGQQAAPFAAGGAGRGGGGGGGRGGGSATGASGGFARQAPAADSTLAGPVRWRLRGSLPAANIPSTNVLERSTDNAVTWQEIKIDPATPQLAAGSAPTNTVCWLAGRAGTVLVSENGTTFRAVTKPTSDDLVSIQASDARTALVRTAAGREFATSDGGATWVRRK